MWDSAYMEDYFGNKNPYFPPQINYLNDGVVEIWENEEAIKWFINQLLDKNIKDGQFLFDIIKKHSDVLQQLNKFFKKEHLSSVMDFKKFIKLVEEGTYTFLAFYYSALDERTPKNIRDKAIDIRSKDAFYDYADRLIKNTIEHLHPYTNGLSISILIKELEAPPCENILRRRFTNCIMIIDGTLEIIKIENFAKNNSQYRFIFPENLDLKYLKGQTAHIGNVSGKVRIIRRKNEINKFMAGEILVSPMTTPDFLPAMKIAKAIITDEGGITCHAAIISRELKKPCIIGSKIATQAFKDGDFVNVDANNGIVKLVNEK